ncbi:hypothetical protein BDY19DRAFT_894298 [Irpex rosettiformis]|uniref:Uncharacterized protein n=1 Tax=Irpex rosettiformis TaxID=378272 RepID=A0ACB8TXM4_9APHY|nr:hypothetical protein BDY19DRAFT_894298 [Irpex rosettiformis]
MDDGERCRRRCGKKPAAPSPLGSLPDSPHPLHAPSVPTASARSVSALPSFPPRQNPDYSMSLSDISEAFANVGKLTGPDNWPMWKFHVETALSTILNFYLLRGGTTVPSEVTSAVFNIMIGHISDSVMVNYLNEKLHERFNPETTMSDMNEIFQLFHLHRPIFEMDKLLDDAQNLYSKLIAKGIDVPSHIFYSAIVGIIPPAYAHTRASYEAGVRATTSVGEKYNYKPTALINELRCEFNNWRLTHPKTTKSKRLSTLVPRNKTTVERSMKSTTTARIATAPYTTDKVDHSKMKCYNCNELGHFTPTCPQPWTKKSKAAMKKKGITQKIAESTITPVMNLLSGSGKGKASQSAWVVSLSDVDVNMHVNPATINSFSILLPLFATSSSDESIHVIDTGATYGLNTTIHCTPYHDLLFNIHLVSTMLLTVSNSEQLTLKLVGNMILQVDQENGEPTQSLLKHVYYNSPLPFTLISVSKMDSDYCFSFYQNVCTIYNSNSSCVAVIKKLNN